MFIPRGYFLPHQRRCSREAENDGLAYDYKIAGWTDIIIEIWNVKFNN